MTGMPGRDGRTPFPPRLLLACPGGRSPVMRFISIIKTCPFANPSYSILTATACRGTFRTASMGDMFCSISVELPRMIWDMFSQMLLWLWGEMQGNECAYVVM